MSPDEATGLTIFRNSSSDEAPATFAMSEDFSGTHCLDQDSLPTPDEWPLRFCALMTVPEEIFCFEL